VNTAIGTVELASENMPEELGAHANAAREREAALATRLHTTTQLDRAFVATLRGAARWRCAGADDSTASRPRSAEALANQQALALDTPAGQGVVRASQWIEQPWVNRLGSHDAGNDRGPNPNFDPEDTKVTTYIDYDNGIVVMRQNPSVELNDSGGPGRVKVGVPQGSIAQTPDGSVRIKYDAGNLPGHHEVGVGSSAFAPFGDAATDFGPVYAPPSVSSTSGQLG
jgi:hypothetical protein